jgi:hypothetical protein
MRRRLLIILPLAASAHFAAGIAAFLWSYRVSFDRLDGRLVGWLSAHLAEPLSRWLWWPLDSLRLSDYRLPAMVAYGALYAQSLAWVLLTYALFRWVRRR